MRTFGKIERDEDGQSLIETMLLLPFLFFVLLWLTQFFIAAQTSEVSQELARNELFKSVNNWRDLRGSSVGNGRDGINLGEDGVAVDDPGRNRAMYGDNKTRLVFQTNPDSRLERKFGPNSGAGMNIETKIGICRTVNCGQ